MAERIRIRGKYDREAETGGIRLIYSAAPGTGGRQRQRAEEVYDSLIQVADNLEDFLDGEFPTNDSTP